MRTHPWRYALSRHLGPERDRDPDTVRRLVGVGVVPLLDV